MSLKSKPRERGQATAEYLIVAVGVVVALVVISIAGRESCVNQMSGDLRTTDCKSLDKSVTNALQKSVEEITFLINLPF